MREFSSRETPAFVSRTDQRRVDMTDRDMREVEVMKALKRAGAVVTLVVNGYDDPITGPLAWFDVNNVALRLAGGIVRAFYKHQVIDWSYDESVVH